MCVCSQQIDLLVIATVYLLHARDLLTLVITYTITRLHITVIVVMMMMI